MMTSLWWITVNRPVLLVSVRSAEEARAAIAGGAGVVDVKEPDRGPLGMADFAVWSAVRSVVPSTVPVSVALGELADWADRPTPPGIGLLGYRVPQDRAGGRGPRVGRGLGRLEADARRPDPLDRRDLCRLDRGEAPEPEAVIAEARSSGCAGVLVDTWDKSGAVVVDRSWAKIVQRIRAEVGLVALAGGLDRERIAGLRGLDCDLFAVRGAACLGGDRRATIDAGRVSDLARACREKDRLHRSRGARTASSGSAIGSRRFTTTTRARSPRRRRRPRRNVASTRPSREASSRVVPRGAVVLLSSTSSSAPRRVATFAAIASVVVSHVRGNGSGEEGSSSSSIRRGARIGTTPRLPRIGDRGARAHDPGIGHQRRQGMGREVERPHGQRVRDLLAHRMDAVEFAHPVGRASASRDQHEALASTPAVGQESREAIGQGGPRQQAAADLRHHDPARHGEGPGSSVASFIKAYAHAASEASRPQTSESLMIRPPAPTTRPATRSARNSPEPETTTALGGPPSDSRAHRAGPTRPGGP